jgi:hypothetical protein
MGSQTAPAGISFPTQRQEIKVRRREFIAGLGAATAWPVGAHAQQPVRPVVGYFHTGTSSGSVADQTAAFRRGLAEAGFVEGATS